MKTLKRCAWDLICLLFCMLVAIGIAVEIVRGDEPAAGSESPGPVLLDFYSDWCGPCKSMAPAVDGLVEAGYRVDRVNVDQRPDLCASIASSRFRALLSSNKARRSIA